MGFLTGATGSIQFGYAENVSGETGWRKNSDTKITNWTITTTQALLNTTTLGSYDKKSEYGLRTTTGTLRLFYYTTGESSYPGNNSGSWFIKTIQRDETMTDPSREVRLRLYVDDNNYKGAVSERDYIEFNANITSISYGVSVGELVGVDVSFEANGEIYKNKN